MSGPFELSGIRGNLRLTFFNGALMETQFSPSEGRDLIAALSHQHPKLPRNPAEEVVVDVRTRFRFAVDSQGNKSFTWYDPKLVDEWKRWVASNA
jgi:hypothetical protein